MTFTDLGTLASLVSSGAVALTLVYVGLQLRQAEKNQRGIMQQGRADRLVAAMLGLADPQIAPVYIKGNQTPELLSTEELERFLLIMRAGFLSGEDSFLQHQSGLLEDAAFNSYAAGVRAQLATWPGMRAAWRMLAYGFGADFGAFMETQLSQVPPQPAPDRLKRWRVVLSEGSNAAGRTPI